MSVSDGSHHYLSPTSEVIMTADGIWSKSDELKLADNEIVLPFEIYERLFDVQSKWYYMSKDLKTVLHRPEEIGQTFTLKLYEHDTGEVYSDYGEVKLAGISFLSINSTSVGFEVFTGNKLFRQIERDADPANIIVQASSVKNLKSFAKTLRRDYLGCIKNVGVIDSTNPSLSGGPFLEPVRLAYGLEEKITSLYFIFLIMGVILLIILLLLVINLISFSITSRKKEIGILSALGTSNKDVTSIFLIETGIISVIIFVVNFALSFTFAAVANLFFSKAEFSSIILSFLRVDLLTIAITIGLSFGLLLLAAMIPLYKIIKLKPIDTIRNV